MNPELATVIWRLREALLVLVEDPGNPYSAAQKAKQILEGIGAHAGDISPQST